MEYQRNTAIEKEAEGGLAALGIVGGTMIKGGVDATKAIFTTGKDAIKDIGWLAGTSAAVIGTAAAYLTYKWNKPPVNSIEKYRGLLYKAELEKKIKLMRRDQTIHHLKDKEQTAKNRTLRITT